MIKQSFINQILNCKAYPDVDIDSDNNLIIMKCRIKFKRNENIEAYSEEKQNVTKKK